MAAIIAGTGSNVGKTTITLAILAFLSQKKAKVQSFKLGPDYIDPMFHRAITQRPCRNLDPILTSNDYVRRCFAEYAAEAEYTLIEGVMGLFDGIAYPPTIENNAPFPLADYGSTAYLARLLNLPLILVIDCSGLSSSLAAIVHGYSTLDPRLQIVGVILNRVASTRHLQLLKNSLQALDVEIFGVFYRQSEITLPSRHLGLIPSEEIVKFQQICDRLAKLAQKGINWQKLSPLLANTPTTYLTAKVSPHTPLLAKHSVRIAVAYDRAFNFYYQDNLDILSRLGAELVYWSPLADKHLPADIQAIYLGGGFPEIFAEELAANELIKQEIKQKILSHVPTYAECGGLMYLCSTIVDFKQKSWEMVGIIPAQAIMTQKLTLGYRQCHVQQNTPVVTHAQTLWGHEFHRSQLSRPSPIPLWQTQTYQPDSPLTPEGWQIKQVHASYVHLHFGQNLAIAKKLVNSCLKSTNCLQ